MGRIIGIRHRVKKTSTGEARPTQVVIIDADSGDVIATHDLEDETAELDFLLGRFPTKRRKVAADDDLSAYRAHQVEWRKMKTEEKPADFPAGQTCQIDKAWYVAKSVPVAFDGFAPGDRVAMVLGGSGDYLAYAAARRASRFETTGGVYRLPPAQLKRVRAADGRKDTDHDGDAVLLARHLHQAAENFQFVGPRDETLIRIQQATRRLLDTMKARIAAEQRLRRLAIGQIFCNPEGEFPEGAISKYFDGLKAADPGVQALIKEESARQRELEALLTAADIYTRLFEPIEGCGPRIAARLISIIGSASRFETPAKLAKFCFVHVMEDGRFARNRTDEECSGGRAARQALYLLGEQFNRRPGSVWGIKLRENKARQRSYHPYPVLVTDEQVAYELKPETFEKKEVAGKKTQYTFPTAEGPVTVTGKLKYSDGHIHKMAMWRTITQFTKWLWREWSRLDRAAQAQAKVQADDPAAA